MADFVHLHLHSEYSLLDGACRIADIPAMAKNMGHSAVAITDHGVLYGAVAFCEACRKEGVKPIVGCEVYVAPRSRHLKEGKGDQSGHHLVLLVKNQAGYRNLCRLVSRSFTEGFYSKPRVDLELLEEYHEGLIALSGCIGGTVPRLILAGDIDSAEKYALKMNGIFGDGNYYLEIQDHKMDEERQVREGILSISRSTGIPMVATGDVHYLRRADAQTQAILMCIQTGTTVADGRPMGFQTDEFYYKSTEEMRRAFVAFPEACENTVRIADACDFEFEYGKLHLPAFPTEAGETTEARIRRLAEKGLSEKRARGELDLEHHPIEEYEARLQYELGVIHRMGFDDYYLIVQDFIAFAKGSGIPVGPGRGSGAGSLVAYTVGITAVDPLRYELLFERFLNPERISMPDFDVDFCYDRRGEVIEYVKRRYGQDHVAQIVTFGTLAARAAVRDVGRAMGMSFQETDVIAKLIPQEANVSIESALSRKELRELYDSSEQVKNVIDVAKALEGMPRHASTHAAGVVITEKPVYEYVPLSGTGDGIVTEFDMDTVAKLGLVKFDFLGLRYLTILNDAERSIRESDPDFDLLRIPLDDAKTYRMLSQGETLGVFQLESGGMRQMLMQLQPSNIQDVIAAIALYRPGPMDSIPQFVARKFGREPVVYHTPLLEDILGVTYGCIVYQEQVMQIFQRLAGYSLAKADLVRRAMSKKKKDVLAAEEEGFVKGCGQNGISADVARTIFREMESFAKYAFNKSHAAAYGILSYRTAYLMCHYRAHFLAALMTSVLGDTAKLADYIGYAHKMGITVLQPDVNRSRVTFSERNGDIVFGLLALKNVGRPFIEALISEREKNGEFSTFPAFLDRMASADVNKRQIEALIKSGALDGLGAFRSQLLAVYEEQLSSRSAQKRANISGQIDLFSDFDGGVSEGSFSIEYPKIPEFTLRERLRLEKESCGMYFSGHLLDEYREELASLEFIPIREIIRDVEEKGEDSPYLARKNLSIVGILTRKNVKTTKNGAEMAFITLEDRQGEIEAILFPKVFDAIGAQLVADTPFFVTGSLSYKEDELPKIIVNRISPIRKKPVKAAPAGARLCLKVDRLESPIGQKALAILERFPGSVPVVIYASAQKKYFQPKHIAVDASEELLAELSRLLSKSNVVLQ